MMDEIISEISLLKKEVQELEDEDPPKIIKKMSKARKVKKPTKKISNGNSQIKKIPQSKK